MIKAVGPEAPHYDEYFRAKKMKDEEYGWSVDVPLCLGGSYIFLYDPQPNNSTDFQKVHIPFGFVLLTRSAIFHGGYGGSKVNLRFSGTFHTNKYDYRGNNTGNRNYLINPNDWQTYIYENVLFKEVKAKKLNQLLL